MKIKRHLIFGSLSIVILSLSLLIWSNTSNLVAQNPLDEDEAVAFQFWGNENDPNLDILLETPDIATTASNGISVGEVYLGYDKRTKTHLDNPSITRHTQNIDLQNFSPKVNSDIDPSRIRFGSHYEFIVEPGITPETYEYLLNINLEDMNTPYVIIQFNFPVDLG